MRGHEPILDMRRQGKRPAIVFLNDFACDTDWTRFGDHATVCVAGDNPELADLRFLIRLNVSICSRTVERAKAFMEAAKRAGAATVAASAPVFGNGYWHEGWADVWSREAEAVHG